MVDSVTVLSKTRLQPNDDHPYLTPVKDSLRIGEEVFLPNKNLVEENKSKGYKWKFNKSWGEFWERAQKINRNQMEKRRKTREFERHRNFGKPSNSLLLTNDTI